MNLPTTTLLIGSGRAARATARVHIACHQTEQKGYMEQEALSRRAETFTARGGMIVYAGVICAEMGKSETCSKVVWAAEVFFSVFMDFSFGVNFSKNYR